MRQSHGSIQGQRKPTAVRAACIGILLLESSPFGVFLVAKTTRCLIFTFFFWHRFGLRWGSGWRLAAVLASEHGSMEAWNG